MNGGLQAMERRFISTAMPRRLVTPAARSSVTIGARSAARLAARALRILRAVAAALACLLIVVSAPSPDKPHEQPTHSAGRGQNAAPAPAKPGNTQECRDSETCSKRPYRD
jgi:hypothetical protein